MDLIIGCLFISRVAYLTKSLTVFQKFLLFLSLLLSRLLYTVQSFFCPQY